MLAALNFRSLKAADLDRMAELERLCFSLPWSRALFESELADPERCFWQVAAQENGPVQAYMGFWKVLEEAHVTNLAVAPGSRRQGLGRALALQTLGLAHTLGCARATLEVRLSNAAAQALYAELGFKPVALRRGYYGDTGEDAVVMWADLPLKGGKGIA